MDERCVFNGGNGVCEAAAASGSIILTESAMLLEAEGGRMVRTPAIPTPQLFSILSSPGSSFPSRASANEVASQTSNSGSVPSVTGNNNSAVLGVSSLLFVAGVVFGIIVLVGC